MSEPLQPPPRSSHPGWRILAGLLGVALVPAVLLGLLITLFAAMGSAQEPNPFIGDGFFSSHPDTWTEVATGTALTTGLVAASVLLVLLSILLLGHAILGRRRVSGRTLLRVPAIAGAATLAVMVAVIVPQAGDARVAPDCDAFVLERRALVGSRGERARGDQLLGIAACNTVDGDRPSEVRAQLGPPDLGDGIISDEDRYSGYSEYGTLILEFDRGRVIDSSVVSPRYD